MQLQPRLEIKTFSPISERCIMPALLLPVGYPNTNLAGTEIKGKNIDPLTGEIVAPNSTVYANKAALKAAAAAAITSGHSAFGIDR